MRSIYFLHSFYCPLCSFLCLLRSIFFFLLLFLGIWIGLWPWIWVLAREQFRKKWLGLPQLKQQFVSLGPLGWLLSKGNITGIPAESSSCVGYRSWSFFSLIDKRVLALKTVSRSGVLIVWCWRHGINSAHEISHPVKSMGSRLHLEFRVSTSLGFIGSCDGSKRESE